MLKDVSVEVKHREVVVVIGPSGSGKSTLLRCVNLLEEPSAKAMLESMLPRLLNENKGALHSV